MALKLYNEIFCFIASHRKGWVFTPSDLTHKFKRQQVDNALSFLVEKGKIRRIGNGIYDYPQWDEWLNMFISPNMKDVANAFARKFKWKIDIHSEYALNYFHLSTQVLVKNIYFTDGANRTYTLFNGSTLEFQKINHKHIGFKYPISYIIVQALLAMEKKRINPKIIAKIKAKVPQDMYKKILKDTQNTTSWIYEVIKEICKD